MCSAHLPTLTPLLCTKATFIIVCRTTLCQVSFVGNLLMKHHRKTFLNSKPQTLKESQSYTVIQVEYYDFTLIYVGIYILSKVIFLDKV